MPHVYIEDIGKHTGEDVTIKGWLHNRRSSGKIHFLTIRDGSGFIQAVMSKAAVGDEVFKNTDHLSQETSLTVTGVARADARAKGGYEIDVTSVNVVAESHDYPITPKEHGVDYLLDRRHLTEFWMVEPEMAYADLDDVMNLAEDLVVSIVGRVLDKRGHELTVLERDLSKLEAVQKPFPRVSYDDAVKTLQSKGLPIEWGGDFGGPDETTLSEQHDRPLMVHRYPAAIKAFYMKPDPVRADLALGVDVLAPEGYGEIIGGGERLADLDLLLARIKEHNLPQEAFEWYLDLRRYGTVPHGGFGMGIERVVAWICKLEHVRETIPYPRMLYRLYP